MDKTDCFTATQTLIFIEREGDKRLLLGPYIEDLTDEIAEKYGQDGRITKFVATGLKNYAFEVGTKDTRS